MGWIPHFVFNLVFSSRGIRTCERNPAEANQALAKPFNCLESYEECLKFAFKTKYRLPQAFTRFFLSQLDH